MGCTGCGASLIDTLLITRLGFTREESEQIKDEAKKKGIEPVQYIKNKVIAEELEKG